jgi:hypothetical protein
MARSQPPFGPEDAVVKQRPSRHRGLHLSVVAFKHGGTPFRAYVHTPGWERIVVVSPNSSAEVAAERAENLVLRASKHGVLVRLPQPLPPTHVSSVQAGGIG